MSKAILVMDMPKSCDMCEFVNKSNPPVYGIDKMYCDFPGIGDDVSDYIECRPDFCPLREMPEEREENHIGTYEYNFNEGWNACIDAIGGGDD